MLSKSVELSPQAPQATTDLHRIALGLESGLSDQCIYSLCCLDGCIVEGITNPVKDEGLWNRCESSLLKLLISSSSGPLLLHTLHTLSVSLQISDPESDLLIPRLIEIVMGDGLFSMRERQLSLRCLCVLELDEMETRAFQRSLMLLLRFSQDDNSVELLTVAVSLMARYFGDYSPEEINEQIIPAMLRRLKLSIHSGSRKSLKLVLACIGLIHLFLENKPEQVHSSCRTSLVALLIERLLGACGCQSGTACEACQGCVSCLLRIGVHPVMREDLRPFMDAVLQVAWNWKSGSPIAAQSLLNMMSGLLH